MANNYGVTANDSSPSQETIDAFFNWCDANPPEVDIDGLTEEAKKYLKEKLEALKDDGQKKLDGMTDGVMDGLKKQEEDLAKLAVMPTDLTTTIAWITNFYKTNIVDPYKRVVEAITWWTQFTASAGSAVAGMSDRTTTMINKLESLPAKAVSGAVSETTSVV